MQLYKGSATVVGRGHDVGLYDTSLATYRATYREADTSDHSKAEGFVELWGLPLKTWAARTGGDHDDG